MPRLIVERGDRFGARAPGRKGRWLGTFDSREEARDAVERARCSRAQRAASPVRRVVKPPSEPQVLAMAAAAPEMFRDRVLADMILVAAYTGLRLFEVAGLQPGDVLVPADGDGYRVRVRRGKGGYADEVSVAFEPAVSVLLARGRVVSAPLLFGPGVTRQWVAPRFKRVAEHVGYEGTFHALRHFHACWLIDAGATDLDVAAQLRHHDNGELVRRRYGRYRATRAALGRIERIGG